ncbi:MAG: hypothetical protein PHH24_01795 [Candidatus Moranbacteria bacterium]|jgi:biopolymer transport protein ExbB/TolQ|nr:hypothetical protein [Candidatus Moranbacteria bacterium]MDD5652042.1 hypothetical protein [Candidatus Moranbacteria bacterium]MDX9855296.1 hypothetical protein [Candidatus Moranbacteria bacterium]
MDSKDIKEVGKVIIIAVLGGILYKASKKFIESDNFDKAVAETGSAIKKAGSAIIEHQKANFADRNKRAAEFEQRARERLKKAIEERKARK